MPNITKINGEGVVEINYIDAHLKMACEAEEKGDSKKARFMFLSALLASEVHDG